MLNFKLIGDPLNCGSPCKKQSILGSIIGGAASLLGDIFTGSSQADAQDSANQTNLQIARETNEANERLWHLQSQYQTQMWNKTNAYNTPLEQKRRLLAAGINPSAVLGNGSMAEASNLSAPSANAAVGAHVEPVNYMAGISQGISNGLNAFYDSQLKSKEIERRGYENKILNSDSIYKDRLNAQNLSYLEKMSKREDFLGEIARTDLAYYQAINGQRISQAFGATRMQNKQMQQLDESIFGQQLMNKLSQIQIAYAPKLNEAELKRYYATINQLNANIGLINANRLLTNEQRLHEIEKRAETIVDYNLKGMDYQLKKATKKYVVETAKENLYMLEDERYLRPYRFDYEMQGKVGQYFPMPSGQYGAKNVFERNQRRDRFK